MKLKDWVILFVLILVSVLAMVAVRYVEERAAEIDNCELFHGVPCEFSAVPVQH